jgi:hypothetical protein
VSERLPLLLLALLFAGNVMAQGSTPGSQQVDGELLRDPTQPPQRSALVPGSVLQPATAVFRLTFVRDGGEQAVAIINGQSVRVGDQIDGAMVLAIEPSGVSLWLDGVRQQLHIWQDSPRRQGRDADN